MKVVVCWLLGGLLSLLNVCSVSAQVPRAGSVDLSFVPDSSPANAVNALLLQPDGKILISGTDSSKNGRLNADGSRDATFAVQQPFRRLLALQPDGRIIVSSVIRTNAEFGIVFAVSRLEADGRPDPSFTPLTTSTSLTILREEGIVAAALRPNGKLLIGGNIVEAGGAPADGLVQLNADGTRDYSFNFTRPVGGPLETLVRGILLQPDEKAVISGYLSDRGLARINPDGTVDSTFSPPALGFDDLLVNTQPLAADRDGSRILVGGGFPITEVFRQWPSGVARLDANGQIDGQFRPVFHFAVSGAMTVGALAVTDDGGILAGGLFTEVNGIARSKIARLLPDGTTDLTFDPGAGATDYLSDRRSTAVDVIRIQPDGKILIGGHFTRVDGVTREGLARLHSGRVPFSAPVIQTQPVSMHVKVGDGVSFSVQATGYPAPSFQWQFSGTNLAGATNPTLILPQTAVENAGAYRVVVTNSQGSITSNEAVLTFYPAMPTVVDPEFHPVLDGGVSLIEQAADDKLLIAGEFSSVSGLAQPGLARLNLDGSIDGAFRPGLAPGSVGDLLLQADGRVLITGSFTNLNNLPVEKVAKLNNDGSLDPSFHPPPVVVGFLAVLSDGRILAQQSEPNGGTSLIRIKQDGSRDETFIKPVLASTTTAIVAAQVRADGNLLVLYRTQSILIGLGPDALFAALLEPNGRVLANPLWNTSYSPVWGSVERLENGALLHITTPVPSPASCWELFRISSLGTNSPLPVCDWPAADYKDGRLIVGTNLLDSATNLIGTIQFTVSSLPAAPAAATQMLIQRDSRIVIGGTFASINGMAQPFLARLIAETNSGPPVITFPLVDEQHAVGDSILLSVQVTSREPVQFQWRHNGVALPGATASALAITNAQTSDAGKYQVTVANSAGEVTSTAALELLGGGAPVISVEPISFSATEGSTASFVVGVTNTAVHYQWQFNGTNLVGATNDTLLITPVLRTEAGNYQVLVSGSEGAVTSQVATLSVSPSVPLIGSHDLSFFPGPDIDSAVDSVSVRSDGKIFISGAFTNRVSGKPSYLVARLNNDGTVDESFRLSRSEAPSDWARALQIVSTADGRAVLRILSSRIQTCGGPCAYQPVWLGKVGQNGAVDNTFPLVSGFVHWLAPTHAGGVLVGSDAPVLRSTPSPGTVERLSPVGTRNVGFAVPIFQGGSIAGILMPGFIDGLVELPDGRVIVAGRYRSVNDVLTAPPSRLLPDGTFDPTFTASLTNLPSAPYTQPSPAIIASQSDGRVVMISAAGELVRLKDTGERDPSFVTSANVAGVIALKDDKLVVWGEFVSLQGALRSRLARLLPNGTLDSSFDPQLPRSGRIATVAVRDDGVVIVAGDGLAGGNVLLLYPRRPLNYTMGPNGFAVRIPTMRPHRYLLEVKDSLADKAWSTAASLLGTGSVEELFDTQPARGQRFYRVRIE